MSRRRIVFVVLVVGFVAVAAVAAIAWARHTTVITPSSPEAERQMRAAVVSYCALREPVRPAKFYGKQLTPVRCVSCMKGLDAQLSAVAGGAYVVRAAVLETMEYGRWDASSRRLTRTGSFSYDEASADEFTLCKVEGVWKVTHVRPWMSFNHESGIHPDSA